MLKGFAAIQTLFSAKSRLEEYALKTKTAAIRSAHNTVQSQFGTLKETTEQGAKKAKQGAKRGSKRSPKKGGRAKRSPKKGGRVRRRTKKTSPKKKKARVHR